MSVFPLAPDVPPPGPLAGVGVLVTRPARHAAGVDAPLAALGARPLVFPAIVILPPADTAALERVHTALDRYDIAVFVSANAVEYGVPAAGRWPARLRAFAPGPGTAAALAAAGVHGATIPATTFDSEGLLALPDLAQPAGKRVVIFRGDGRRELLGDTLKARGATVDYVGCYRRAAPQSGAGGLVETLREGRLHASTFTSSEGLDNLVALLDAEALRRFKAIPAFVPHPRIAERAHPRPRAGRRHRHADAPPRRAAEARDPLEPGRGS